MHSRSNASPRRTVLVLGASGRLGRHATLAFADAGWRVRTLARRELDPALPGEHRRGDVLDARTFNLCADGANVIVNGLNPPYGRWAREVPALTEAVIAGARRSGATVMLPGNVYALGEAMPARLSGSVPDRPSTALGRVRAELEARYRDAARTSAGNPVRTIVVRAGDFIEGVATGAWFEDHVLKRIAADRVTYPGPLDRSHAWAWLPDLARAFVALAERRETLAAFQPVGFPGWSPTGRELIDALQRALGREVRVDAMPWPLLRTFAPFSPTLRGVVSMRYLWDRPHAIDGGDFERLVPDFRGTPLDDGLRAALSSLGVSAVPPAARPADAGVGA